MSNLSSKPNLLGKSARQASAAVAGYSPDEERPLAGYAGAVGVYTAVTATLAGIARVQRRKLPRPSAFDVFLVAAATHKLSRLIAKDTVTSPLRAPFTRFEGPSGDAELQEKVRGSGARHAVGELITCPFCLGQWIATGFAFGLIFAPGATRLAAATMTAIAGSDFLQLAYAWGQRQAEG
jgi:hypothetical protein